MTQPRPGWWRYLKLNGFLPWLGPVSHGHTYTSLLWLVRTQEYWALIGQWREILAPDWSERRNTGLWLVRERRGGMVSPHMGLCCFIIYQASISSSYKHGTFKLEYGMRNKKRDQRVSKVGRFCNYHMSSLSCEVAPWKFVIQRKCFNDGCVMVTGHSHLGLCQKGRSSFCKYKITSQSLIVNSK